MDEIILLNRVRVDIGNVSGSLSELMQYATLKGFNDNYEPQEKPRLVGTWTINDWYISEQLTQARNTFDGLTIVENNEFLIDFNNLAVQTLDSTQPNYNPAVAIILHNNGIGNLLDFYYHETGGKYFLTKSEAAESRNMSNKFTRKVNIADTNLIVSNTNASYTFSSFDEMQYFTNTAFWQNNQNTEHGFMYCTELVSVTFPTNVTCLGSNQNTDSYGIFYGCSKLNFPISRLANITRIPGFANEGWGSRLGCFGGCSSLNWETISSDDLPNLTYLGSGAFMGCTKIKHVTLNLSSLNKETFYGCSGLQDLSLPNATSIPAGFCANCTSLTTLSIPQCTYIGIYAFANCGSLTTINNSTHLDELYQTCNADVGTFVKCYSLKYYASTINKEIHTQEFGGVQFMNRDLIVTNSSFELSWNIKFGDCFTFQNRTNGIDTITFTNITQMCPQSFNRTSMTGNYIIRIDTNAPPTLNTTYNGDWNRYPIKTNVYVGNGTASHDEALIDAYSVATNWTELYNRGMLLPWYLHEHTPALQSYNSSAPNYYPALCICFEQAGYGRYITTNNKTKGWYMSDEEAASITDTGNILKDKLTVTDVNGICGTVGATYTLTSADLSAFTNIESIDLSGSTKMSNVTIAQNSPLSKYKLPTVEDCDWRNSGGYIESSGTQYIDTGIVLNNLINNYVIEFDFIPTNVSVADSKILSTRNMLYIVYSGKFQVNLENSVTVVTNQLLNNQRYYGIINSNESYISLNNERATVSVLQNQRTDNNLILFAYNNNSNIQDFFYGKLFSLKIYTNDTLVREMYPAVDFNGIYCMYDYVTEQFFYNQGTGSFTISDKVIAKGKGIPVNSSSNAYWRYSGGYIESNGSQYFDIGIVPTTDTVVKIKAIRPMFGVCHQGNGNGMWFASMPSSNTNCEFFLGTLSQKHVISNSGTLSEYELSYGEYLKRDGTTIYTGNQGIPVSSHSMYLFQAFNLQTNSPESRGFTSKLYSFIVEQNNTLVREMYPAVDSNGVVCMYDYVSDQYLYNQGSGELTVSSEVINLPKLELGVPSQINSFTFNNCPNIDSIKLLSKIASAQDTLLNTVNATIPNTTGSIEDLISIAALWNNQSGENSNLKISGNYIVNNAFITIAQCEAIGYNPNGATTQMSSKIYGLMITIDPGSIIVLQSYDSTDTTTYNPAMCILFKNEGSLIDDNDPTQGWYMTKAQAGVRTNFGRFSYHKINTVTDTDGICGTVGATYDFSELWGNIFYNIISTGAYNFRECTKIKTIIIGENLTTIQEGFCENATNITFISYAVTPPTTAYGTIHPTFQHIYVPFESVDMYKSAAFWSDYASIIEAIPSN